MSAATRRGFPRFAAVAAATALAGIGPSIATVATPAAAAEGPPLVAAKAAASASATPDIKLTIEASTPRGVWRMRVTNEGDVPVTLAADARLLAIDVTPRDARKPEHCELPADMRPDDDLTRPLVLPPKRSYAERFEPRLYCLDGRRLDALAPGAMVVATLGFAGRAKRAPFVVSPIEGLEAKATPLKTLVSAPIALPDDPGPAFGPRDPALPARPEPALSVRTPTAVDAMHADEIAIPVTLTNTGHRAAIVRFRPETISFDVVGPAETTHCAWVALPAAPTRELFATLAPGGQTSLTLLLSAYCPTRMLTGSGLYVVRATFDTRKASGADIGIRSFDGQVIAVSPTIVRLRHGTLADPLVRPQLQPQ
ncbi:MAG TPA: hypothetical protein VH044_03870 [Polyangiaceae bacterium]|nr:hypothetical protein [Polyangiaceae bacterium]